MNRRLLSIGALLVAAALFLGVNILGAAALGGGGGGARIDLTEGKLYTLSAGSKNIARGLDEPITLTLYYSEEGANENPGIKAYAMRVREVLGEYARASGGTIRLEIVDPAPFTDVEDRAVQAGLAGVPVNAAGDRIYFGLVATNSTDEQRVIPLFDPRKEAFLEYDLTRLIYALSNPEKKKVGLMTSLPMEGSMGNPMTGEGRTGAWQILQQMREVFEVETVAPDAAALPADLDVLMVVHPKELSEATRYAIDQYVLRGGRLLVFVDPVCDTELATMQGRNQMEMMTMPRSSDLPELFRAWGIELAPQMVAADRLAAQRVVVGGQGRPEPVDYVVWLALDQDNLNQDDSITGQLTRVHMATAGILQKVEGGAGEVTPLIETSEESMRLEASAVQFFPDPKKLLAEFKPEGKKLTLAARVSGTVRSAFPEGKPGGVNEENGEAGMVPAPPPEGGHVAEAAGPVNVVVVADCDLLADQAWVTEDRLGQFSLGFRKLADNGDLVLGLLDNLSGSSDLISVRARGRFSRPFERVEQIRKDAEQRHQAKEQGLMAKLQETEQKIGELQRARPDASGQTGVILTAEQQAEIERFRAEMLDTRKELRDVRHQLRQDIDELGTRLKFVNIGLMPVLVGLAAVGLGAYRAGRRRSAVRRAPVG